MAFKEKSSQGPWVYGYRNFTYSAVVFFSSGLFCPGYVILCVKKWKNFQKDKTPFYKKHHGDVLQVDKIVLHLALKPMQEISNNEISIDFKS